MVAPATSTVSDLDDYGNVAITGAADPNRKKLDPARWLAREKRRKRFRFAHRHGPAHEPPTPLDARIYRDRVAMDLPPVPELAEVCWPPERIHGLFQRGIADQTWIWLASQPVEDVSVALYVLMDLRLNLQPVLIPERQGRSKPVQRWLIERTETYLGYGAGGVDLDRVKPFRNVKRLFRVEEVPADLLRQAGIKLRHGASRGHYLFTGRKRGILDAIIEALEAHGIRLPAGVQPPTKSRAPIADTEALVDVHGDRIRCPVHGIDGQDQDPSCSVFPNGALYCFGKCGCFVGEWKDPDHADWSIRPVFDRSLRQQEKDSGNRIPSRVLIRLFSEQDRAEHKDADQREVQRVGQRQYHGPALVAQGGHGESAEVDLDVASAGSEASPPTTQRDIVFTMPKPEPVGRLSNATLTLHSQAATAGAPGPHPLDRLTRTRDSWMQASAWKHLRDRFPTSTQEIAITPPHLLGSRIRALGHLRCTQVMSSRSRKGTMGRRYDTSPDLIEAQINADRYSKSRNVVADTLKVYNTALDVTGGQAPDPLDIDLADRVSERLGGQRRKSCLSLKPLRQQYISVGVWAHTQVKMGPYCRVEPDQQSFTEQGTKYILIDVDKIQIPELADSEMSADEQEYAPWFKIHGGKHKRGPSKGEHVDYGDRCLNKAGEIIAPRIAASPVLTGRFYVLRSGPNGVQVAVELKDTRWDVRALWQSKGWRALVKALGEHVMDALHWVGCEGGILDPNVNHPGNLARVASWRVAKDGSLFRSRLIYTTGKRPWQV